jgi:1-acyl-sn-glycerol-3-phosphate acyltransferase
MLRKLYKIYAWLVFAPILGLSTVFFGTATVILLFFLKPRLVSTLCGKSWARVNSFFTPMRVTVKGRENVDPKQSYVIVSNHQSQFDIFVLYGWLDIDFKWVMKKELRKVPAIGIACERLGHIYVDRSNREAALASIDAAKQRIVDGTSVLFFPEGTRSREKRMRPFKNGARSAAADPAHYHPGNPGYSSLRYIGPLPGAGYHDHQPPHRRRPLRQHTPEGIDRSHPRSDRGTRNRVRLTGSGDCGCRLR